MKKYDSYKDSGVEWIGELPVDWSCVRLKTIVKEPLKYGANESAEDDNPNNPRYIRITDFGSNGNLKDDTFKSLPFEIAQNYLLEDGDILFARSGATVGKTFLFKNYKGIACYAGYLIKATFDKSKINSTYIDYVTRSNYYENWKSSIFQQATIQNIGADKYNLFKLPIPNRIDEQNAIVDFLDHKTNQIDQLIAKKEQFIKLLEEERVAVINQAVTKGLDPNVSMRDSGIEWLGEIPEHWEISKFGFEVIIKRGAGYQYIEQTEQDDFEPLIRISDFKNFEPLKAIPRQEFNNYRIKKGDILIAGTGATAGICIMSDNKMEGMVHSYNALRLIPKKSLPYFLYYCLDAHFVNEQKNLAFTGSAQPFLDVGRISNLLLAIPSIEEQNKVVEFIETQIKRIQTIVDKTKQEIELLKEYKTSLISEVVTGKLDVRNEILN